MRTVYVVIGWMIIALGAVHIAAAPHYFAALTPRAIWFISGGLAIAQAGAMNVANQRYGASARGLRWLTFGSNVVMSAFAAVAGAIDHAAIWQLALIPGMFLVASALSCAPRALKPPGGAV